MLYEYFMWRGDKNDTLREARRRFKQKRGKSPTHIFVRFKSAMDEVRRTAKQLGLEWGTPPHPICVDFALWRKENG